MLFARRRYFADNYTYLLADGDDAAVVDPGDAAVALALCAEHRVHPRWILHTHGHPDHTGGSAEARRVLSAPVLGHRGDAGLFAPDEDLAGRDEVRLGRLVLRVHQTPGHTPGSVLLEWQGKLLTGDTLFGLGCGKAVHGDPAQLAESFLGVIAGLPGALEVHPGHDYVERNLPFARALDRGGAAAARGRAAEAARVAGREPDAVTLEVERAANPFLRLDAPEVVAAVAAAAPRARTPVERFVALRRLRDQA